MSRFLVLVSVLIVALSLGPVAHAQHWGYGGWHGGGYGWHGGGYGGWHGGYGGWHGGYWRGGRWYGSPYSRQYWCGYGASPTGYCWGW